MKKFGLTILLFFIPLFILAELGDYWITQSLRKSKDKYFVVWNDLVSGNLNSKILIYGTSRARAHVNPKIVEDTLHLSTYNLGIDGYTFKMEYCRHQLVLDKNEKPSYIIQTLDYHMLGDIENLYQYEQFYPYFDNEIILKTIKTYKGLNWWDYHIPLVRYYGSTKEITSATNILLRPSHNKGNRYKGFYNVNQSWTNEFEKVKESKKGIHQKLIKEQIILFENYLADTKKRGIHIIFVYTPEHIDGQNFVSNRAEIITLYKKMAAKYDIPFIDYSSDPMCFNRDYFYNAEHLNLKGTNLFSKKLASDLKKYIKVSE
ncbi:hypothetical protein [Flavobacterium psychrotolerans]|uniref:SGNH/GDSL hydrolase family protein n=1 Tax=Flavobacterium psychrotolerans TaxID=2169410 RepID=A0A2U1JI66_9FLAO|nr:hypothetical protein [Flavobacterium psychrotolerans]PWA04846.1 hypothetical protein DB895_08755 [Flavobacterium psychrotolerans]